MFTRLPAFPSCPRDATSPRHVAPRLASGLLAAALLAASLLPAPATAQSGTPPSSTSPSSTPPSTTPQSTPPMAGAAAPVTVDGAWTRATVDKQRSTGAFFGLTATQSTRLVAVESPAAEIVEVHEMALVDNIMRMRAVDAIPLEAGQRIELKPGGLHVMLIDLRKPVKVGDAIPLTLVFEDAQGRQTRQAIAATARPLTSGAGERTHDSAGHGTHGGHGAQGGDSGDSGAGDPGAHPAQGSHDGHGQHGATAKPGSHGAPVQPGR